MNRKKEKGDLEENKRDVTVEPLRLGRGKRRRVQVRLQKKHSSEERIERFKELEKQFITLGRIIGKEETFKAKLNSAICYGLAEVCEMLATAVEEASKE